MSTLLLPCDVVLVRSHHFVGNAIRFFTRSIGESVTIASHSGLIVEPGIELDATICEANAVGTQILTLRKSYEGTNSEICVFRPINLTQDEKDIIVAKAKSYEGRRYGYGKLGLHLLDWCLNGAYVFRRLGRMDRWPICSYEVATAFKEAGKDFGVSTYAASPDDIMDFCIKHLGTKYNFTWQHGTMFNTALLNTPITRV